MPVSPLNRVLYLKSILDKATADVRNKLSNIESDLLCHFDADFKAIFDEFVAIEKETDEQDRDVALYEHTKLNRGDRGKLRFFEGKDYTYKFLPSFTHLEDQLSQLTKKFIEHLEDNHLSPTLIQAYREREIYQMLYHYGNMGEYIVIDHTKPFHVKNNPPYGPFVLKVAAFHLSIAALAVAGFATICFLGLSGIWLSVAIALLSVAVTYMAGLLYGVLNDIFATKSNLPYFLLGHQYGQRSFFISNDPLTQAAGWGVLASHPIARVASVIFGVSIFITLAAANVSAVTFVFPVLLAAIPLLVLCADAYARYTANQYKQKGISLAVFPEETKKQIRHAFSLDKNAEWISLEKIDFESEAFRTLAENYKAFNLYQCDGLALMSNTPQAKAKWFANGTRNMLGYVCLPLIGITCVAACLTLAMVGMPPVFFSPLLSTIIPTIAAGIVLLFLIAAVSYALVNQEKQIDNRYKLSTTSEPRIINEIYLNKKQEKEASVLTEYEKSPSAQVSR